MGAVPLGTSALPCHPLFLGLVPTINVPKLFWNLLVLSHVSLVMRESGILPCMFSVISYYMIIFTLGYL